MTIELNGLRFFAEHGMYAEEKKVGNEFEVDVAISYRAPRDTITSINETINYVEVYRIVEKELTGQKLLLETCAMNICGELHQLFPQIRKIFVSIKKINPPITNFTGFVGVSFTKKFK